MTSVRRRSSACTLLVAPALIVAIGLGGRAGATAMLETAAIEVTPAVVEPGGSVRVELIGWPGGVATAQICGNGARRGSSDCDQVGAESVRVPDSGHEFLGLQVREPPVGCPCVVRVTTTRGDVTRTAPVTVEGVSDGVDLAPTTFVPASSSMDVAAVVEQPRGLLSDLGDATGTRRRRTLVVTVRNESLVDAVGLRFSGTVGPTGGSGTPVSAALADTPAGGTTTTRIPLSLPLRPVGRLEVAGTVSGLDVPVPLSTTITVDPWLLELLVPILLLVVARSARRRAKRRATGEMETRVGIAEPFVAVVTAPVDLPASEVPQVATDCSPGVGTVDDPHWESAPYDSVAASVVIPVEVAGSVEVRELEHV